VTPILVPIWTSRPSSRERTADGVDQALAQLACFMFVADPFAEDTELVRAEAGNEVTGPDRHSEPSGNLDEQPVAGIVT